MRKFFLECLIAIPMTGFLAYFGQMDLPVIILALAMLLDLATGLFKAWTLKTLSSKTAFEGVLKKAASFVAVFVGVGIDYLLPAILESLGIAYSPKLIFGLLVVLWLCVNEFVSVLENLQSLGVPFPKFLQKIADSLKQKIGQDGDVYAATLERGDKHNDSANTSTLDSSGVAGGDIYTTILEHEDEKTEDENEQ